MTDNEIIQALRICPSMKIIVNLNEGYVITVQDILDIINRQKAENKVLTIQKNVYEAAMKAERLQADNARLIAIKEFAGKFKRGCGRVKTEGQSMLVCRESSFDNLVKEMTEGV